MSPAREPQPQLASEPPEPQYQDPIEAAIASLPERAQRQLRAIGEMLMPNANKYRYSMSGLPVQEESKWGHEAASRRGLSPKLADGAPSPEDRHAPQPVGDPKMNLQGPGHQNDVPNDWRRGGGPGGAEGKPNFDRAEQKSELQRQGQSRQLARSQQ